MAPRPRKHGPADAHLGDADLTNADLDNANLSGADLSGAKGVASDMMRCALVDDKTVLRDGVTRPAPCRKVPLFPQSPPLQDVAGPPRATCLGSSRRRSRRAIRFEGPPDW
ncbi:pentapeptide repeat-containing protein [Micromonospora carbonacea]|uniref:Pentapeptide repeat-containing protein n=1 Tax=Micromonospora carbonacea TaxID=47853 RepID=A0A7H8XNX0_9ACTN|nr:pentapeptide repeat-containing protein [Micromonospora carbonacea]